MTMPPRPEGPPLWWIAAVLAVAFGVAAGVELAVLGATGFIPLGLASYAAWIAFSEYERRSQ